MHWQIGRKDFTDPAAASDESGDDASASRVQAGSLAADQDGESEGEEDSEEGDDTVSDLGLAPQAGPSSGRTGRTRRRRATGRRHGVQGRGSRLRDLGTSLMDRPLDQPADERIVGTAPPVPIATSMSPIRRLQVGATGSLSPCLCLRLSRGLPVSPVSQAVPRAGGVRIVTLYSFKLAGLP